MVHIISKNTTPQELDDMLLSGRRRKRKTINLEKYSGKVKFGVDGLDYQKKVRNI